MEELIMYCVDKSFFYLLCHMMFCIHIYSFDVWTEIESSPLFWYYPLSYIFLLLHLKMELTMQCLWMAFKFFQSSVSEINVQCPCLMLMLMCLLFALSDTMTWIFLVVFLTKFCISCHLCPLHSRSENSSREFWNFLG